MKELKQQNKKQQTEEKEKSELMTVHEVASHLRVDDTTVRRWIKNGALDAITLPRRGERCSYRIRKTDFDALLNGPATKAS